MCWAANRAAIARVLLKMIDATADPWEINPSPNTPAKLFVGIVHLRSWLGIQSLGLWAFQS